MKQSPNYTEVVLSCRSWQEAQKLTDVLLRSAYVFAVETIEVRPSQWRLNHQSASSKIKLIVQVSKEHTGLVKDAARALRARHTRQPLALFVHGSHEVALWLKKAIDHRSATLKR